MEPLDSYVSHNEILSLLKNTSEKAMAPHSTWLEIPRTEEPSRLQSMGSL